MSVPPCSSQLSKNLSPAALSHPKSHTSARNRDDVRIVLDLLRGASTSGCVDYNVLKGSTRSSVVFAGSTFVYVFFRHGSPNPHASYV